MAKAIRFGLLGPVDVCVDDQPVALAGRRTRAVLAALLLDANRVVPLDRLVEAGWGDEPPAGARVHTQNRVSVLRRLLADAGVGSVITTRGTGYLINVDPGQLDLAEFTDLVRRAEHDLKSGQLDLAAHGLAEALALWRGPALDGLASQRLSAAASRLDEMRLSAQECLIDVRLRLRQHEAVTGELVELVATHPWRERLTGLVMTALYRANRQHEALAAFDRLRHRLRDELGMDPGHELVRLRDLILRKDPELDLPPMHATRRAGSLPAQLPPRPANFVARVAELAQLDKLAGAPTVVVIDGPAGVGKTAMAVLWAHRVVDRFPNGQLYLNLLGFGPTGVPMTTTAALRYLLDAFAVSPSRIPASFDAQVGMYRGLLAGRRVLIVLDNARDSEQVRPLLPAAPGCLAIVTSRTQLPGLVAADGAHPMTLDLLSTVDARELLVGRIGQDRVAAAPAAVEKLINSCAGLPLALAIVAARAVCNPGLALAALATDLDGIRGGLDAFTTADSATDLRSVLSWSYRALDHEAGRLFRLLSLHPAPDFAPSAAASLAGHPVRKTMRLLAELTRLNLISERSPGRYWLHELVRTYAAELVDTVDGDTDRLAALHRLLDSYLHTAHSAALLLNPHRDQIDLSPAQPGVVPHRLGDQAAALAWFTAERLSLVASVDLAERHAFDAHAWQIAWTATDFFDREGYWIDSAAIQQAALRAAVRLDDRCAQAYAHRGLGGVCARLERFGDARDHQSRAIELFGEIGDRIGQARSRLNLIYIASLQGEHRLAVRQADAALRDFRSAGDRAWQAKTLNLAGWHRIHLGEHRKAVSCCEQALALAQELGDRYVEAASWDSLGLAHHHLGQHERAVACYQQAIDLTRQVGSRANEAGILNRLGDTYARTRYTLAARKAWLDALQILDELASREADEVRAKLNHL